MQKAALAPGRMMFIADESGTKASYRMKSIKVSSSCPGCSMAPRVHTRCVGRGGNIKVATRNTAHRARRRKKSERVANKEDDEKTIK